MNNQTIIVLCLGGILFSVQALSAAYLSTLEEFMYGKHTQHVYKIKAQMYFRMAKLHTLFTVLCCLSMIIGVSC